MTDLSDDLARLPGFVYDIKYRYRSCVNRARRDIRVARRSAHAISHCILLVNVPAVRLWVAQITWICWGSKSAYAGLPLRIRGSESPR
jgi:hypothetical protein